MQDSKKGLLPYALTVGSLMYAMSCTRPIFCKDGE